MKGAIYVVRHGQTAWNIAGRRQGRSDSPLTELGIAQAIAVGRALRRELDGANGVALACSPLGRARVTARIVCRELGLHESAIAIDPLLAEYDQGAWRASPPGHGALAGLRRRAAEKWSRDSRRRVLCRRARARAPARSRGEGDHDRGHTGC